MKTLLKVGLILVFFGRIKIGLVGIWFLWLPFHWYRFGFGLDRSLGKDSGIRFGRV